jgi:hypothetical protein
MKKLFAVAAIFALVLAGCGGGDDDSGGNGTNDKIGNTGPGGGIIFFDSGGQYKECSEDLGFDGWNVAKNTAENYKGGGFTDWRLPDKEELDLMYSNLHLKGLGDFLVGWHWSSAEDANDTAYCKFFTVDSWGGHTNGAWNLDLKVGRGFQIRAVRSFSL